MKKVQQINQMKSWESYLKPGDELLWIGQPLLPNFLKFLIVNRKSKKWTFNAVKLLILLAFMIVFNYILYSEGSIEYLLLSNFCVLVLPLCIVSLNYYAVKNRRYAITKRFVLFKLPKLLSFKVHEIPMEKIIGIKILDREEDKGTLEIRVQQKFSFRSYDIQHSIVLDHPIMELVGNIDRAFALIKRSTKDKPSYQWTVQPTLMDQIQLSLRSYTGFIVQYLLIRISNNFYKLKQKIKGINEDRKNRLLFGLQVLAFIYACFAFKLFIIPALTSFEILHVFHACAFLSLGLVLIICIAIVNQQIEIKKADVYSIISVIGTATFFYSVVYLACT